MKPNVAMGAGFSVGIKEAMRAAKQIVADYNPGDPGEAWGITQGRLRKQLDQALRHLDLTNPFDVE